jgi:hypothetical protein
MPRLIVAIALALALVLSAFSSRRRSNTAMFLLIVFALNGAARGN